MKLIFKKTSDDIDVSILDKNGSTTDFSYVEMVNRLFIDKNAEEPVFDGDFTEQEKDSLKELFQEINNKCFKTDETEN